MQLYDPKGAEVWSQTDQVKGMHGFTTEHSGDYKACFYKTDTAKEDLNKHKVRLDWKSGIAAADWENIAKASNVDDLQKTLRELAAEMKSIHEGMLYLRKKEAEMRDLNEATNSKVAWLSVISLSVCISLAVWQIFYLKNFFERKKLL